MSIVKMKRIRLIALRQDRDALLSGLLHVGCVEVNEPTQALADEAFAALLQRETANLPEAKVAQNELKQALDTLNRYAPQKSSMFAPRYQVEERELMSREALDHALATAADINSRAKAIGGCTTREARLTTEQQALAPWRSYDLPLEEKGTRTTSIWLGTVPSAVDVQAMAGAVEEAAGAAWVNVLSSDREQHCLEVVCYRGCEDAALEALRSYGFSFAQMKDLTGTVEENIQRLDREIQQAREQQQREIEAIKALGDSRKELKISMDRAATAVETEETKARLLQSGSILYLDGWVPALKEQELGALLAKFDCAYELTDPAPEEYPKVPVKLKNGPLTRCMNMVTEMYSLPVYGSLDPNPLMAPFFILFYGIMMADMGYGILMVGGALFALKKLKPRGGARNFAELLLFCGISTFIIGALTGGFFGDFIPQIAKIINPNTTLTELPSLFTPLNDTMAILVGSLVLGFIQIITGQIISFVKKGMDGHIMDGVWDEGPWWVIYLGVGLMVLGVGNVAGYPVVLIVGILMLAYGATRNAKGIGKVGAFVGAVYNGATGIFGDVLSYARLMALMLSGSIIASVFNTLGAITNSVIPFIIISVIGNALNFALNLLGCYVHDLRLQCLEFFKTFYQDGGRPFRPLAINTKYVDIKEEN